MNELLTTTSNELQLFLLVATRVGALVMSAPHLGAAVVPVRVRLFLTLALAVLLTPLAGDGAAPPATNLAALALQIIQEMMIGTALGLAIQILVAGLQISGQTASQMAGVSLADVIDPTFESQIPAFSQILNLVALLIFLVGGGHHELMRALIDSFRWLPPGQSPPTVELTDALMEITSQSFVLGLRAAAPVMVALLVATILLALVSRTVPQLNVMQLGFGVNIIVLLGTLAMSLGTIVWVFQEEVTSALQLLQEAMMKSP